MRDRILLVLKFLMLVVGIGILVLIRESLPIISGYGAKVLCSGVFVAGRNPEQVIKNDLSSFPSSLGTYTVDRADSSATGKVWGFAVRKAIYRTGLGATLVSGVTEEELREQRMDRAAAPGVNPDTVDWPMGDRVVGRVELLGGGPGEPMEGGVDTASLRRSVGMAFGDDGIKGTGTRAVIVVHGGRIVAERYAPGFDRHTRLTGWSMTKSVTNALIGILVREGRLNVAESAPVDSWQEEERSKITIENLMRMNSGLKWWEFYGGPSDATRMLYKEKDMGEYAMRSKPGHRPGDVFNYSSGTANILSSIIRRTVGDSDYYRFPYEQLFYRIGMYSAVLEPDAGGTFVGSSYCYATARDWARFGILYLQDGVWNGRRVLPAGWVDFTRRGEEYGALWWLNRNGRHPHIPRDCYGCEGYEGQYVWVIPSKDLVVVRLALENGRKLDPDMFVPAVVGAMR
jgi:CubicO group peptidase (beta-lactamase class C family)